MSEVNGRLAAPCPDAPPFRRHRAFRTPANGRRAGATPFRARAFVVAAGACSPGRITPLSPFAGAETSTTRLAVHGLLSHGHKNFLPEPAKLFTSGMDICTGPCSFTPLRRTALKRVKVTTSGQVQQVPAKVKTAAPATQRVMVLKGKTTE
jgi:single-strand DNA-binding protein